MLSLRLHGGAAAAQRLLDALTIPTVAPSLGGVESLVTLPAQTSHAGMSAAERERVGVTDDLMRVSCGIEGTDDLVADFAQALEAASVPAAWPEGVSLRSAIAHVYRRHRAAPSRWATQAKGEVPARAMRIQAVMIGNRSRQRRASARRAQRPRRSRDPAPPAPCHRAT